MIRIEYNIETGETIEHLVSDEEIAAAQTAEAARLAAITYAEKRAAEYPSFADQFDLLYHGGYDVWKAAIQVVKDKYPKPGA